MPKTQISSSDGITPIWMRTSNHTFDAQERFPVHSTSDESPFGWQASDTLSSDALAELLLRRFARLSEQCRGTDPEYTGWLQDLRELLDDNCWPIAFSDYGSDLLGEIPVFCEEPGDACHRLRLPPPGTGLIRNPTATDSINRLRNKLSQAELQLSDLIWLNRESFFRWPKQDITLWPGRTREKYHQYPEPLKLQLGAAGIKPNSLSNGPALVAFQFAGGERPTKENGHGWTVHHIYDGRFLLPDCTDVPVAVKDGGLFTRTAGLVAAHPAADALAGETSYASWLLRAEAFTRFKFDPSDFFVR